MDSLQINTGEKRIPVIRDGVSAGEIVFNPSDVLFAEKFYALIGEFETKMNEYKARAEALDKIKETGEHNIPVNTEERMAVLHEACEYVRERIDNLFGENASQVAFGNALSMDTFQQFFEGITPFIKTARADKVAKYTSPASAKRHKRSLK